MNLFVTAGNTLVLIDQVRCLTNIFTGRTGTAIALCAASRGHTVCLATSHPEAVEDLTSEYAIPDAQRWTCLTYRTFEDLQKLMSERITEGNLDAIIHCAAVSDYLSAGVFAPSPHTCFDVPSASWHSTAGRPAAMVDRAAGKVKSDEPELWLRLVRAPKLVDRIRTDWGFRGILVKFKLEVGITQEILLDIAESSRRHSHADLMVANTLEGAAHWALLGPLVFPSPLRGREDGGEGVAAAYQKVSRRDLPSRLLEAIEALHQEKIHG